MMTDSEILEALMPFIRALAEGDARRDYAAYREQRGEYDLVGAERVAPQEAGK